jgi:hypothetical protein
MEQCEQLTVPIWVLLLPTSVFLALAGSLVLELQFNAMGLFFVSTRLI